jgi:nucleoid-associated protein YgaU
MAYSAGETALNSAQTSYASEDYKSAAEYAGQVVAALDGVYEITPLPQFYIVRPWADTKDCYWNISGRPYIYNNPLLWENLYQKNKKAMPKAEDPNLILPGMKMEIPSLSGEYREGTYDPSKKYNAYDVNR